MEQSTIIVLVVVALAIVAFMAYQRQQAQIAQAALANAPRNQIGAGVGSLLSGILGAAGVS